MGSGYRWLIQNYLQTWLNSTCQITFDTDVAVHAWLCHSTEPPNMHLLTKTVRGLRVMGSPYYCFLKQDCFEQDEAGDTLTHTFTWPGWYTCLWQWFFFKATVAGVWTPTQWGIFKKHYLAPESYILTLNGQGDEWSIQHAWGAPNHWLASRDADTTWFPPDPHYLYGHFEGAYVYMRVYDGYQWGRDLYTLEYFTPAASEILSVTVWIRLGKLYVYGRATTSLKTHDTVYDGPVINIPAPGLFWFPEVYTTNPFTRLPWTFGELSILQAGLQLAHAGTFGRAISDQVKVEVSYRPRV